MHLKHYIPTNFFIGNYTIISMAPQKSMPMFPYISVKVDYAGCPSEYFLIMLPKDFELLKDGSHRTVRTGLP